MKCGNCEAKFSTDEAVPVYGTSQHGSRGQVTAHECPGCGETLSTRFTREQNINRCGHNATVDGHSPEGYRETCSECGAVWDAQGTRVDTKEAWAIPSD